MESLKEVLMRRDEMSSEEANELIEEAKELVIDGEDPEEVLLDMFGLEPDFIFDILD